MKQLLERVLLEVSLKKKFITTPPPKDKETLHVVLFVVLYSLQIELHTFVNKNCREVT